MATLTPAGKAIVALTILGGAAAVGYYLTTNGTSDQPSSKDEKVAAGGGNIFGNGGAAASGPVGTKSNPLKVSIVSFHGYAPALVANGASLTTQPGSIFDKNGVNVEFVVQDDIPTLPVVFESGAAHCAWRTSDFWAQEHPALRGNKLDGKAIVIVDNTRGADAIIAKDKSINRIEDLPGKKVGLLQFTPSDGMFIDAVNNSSLSGRKKQSIEPVYINADEGTAGVRAAFVAGQVDAAILWDPDLSLALNAVPGAHVVYSTKTATNLIYDLIVCDSRVLDDPANESALQGFVTGWMQGVDAAEKNPDAAVDALVSTEEMFKLLAKDEGKPFIKGLFDNILWTGLEDNARVLGRAGGQNHFERVYKQFDQIYRAAGYIADPNAPVINPSDAFDYRFIDAMLAKDAKAKTDAQQPEYSFTEKERTKAEAAPPTVTKPVEVNFTTGSAELTKRSQQVIDSEMVPLLDSMGNAYFEVAGNTDSTGSRAGNVALSQKRAQSVVDYLVSQWEYDAKRFVVKGNGPDEPLCNEAKPDDYEPGTTVEACRTLNRRTRVAVLTR